jgi:transposase
MLSKGYADCVILSKEARMVKLHIVSLSDPQQRILRRLINTGRESTRKITRARILLKAAAGEGDQEIADALEVGVATVERVRKRFASGGIGAALERKPQPPRLQKRRLDGDGEARLVMLACSTPPDGHERWTLDLLADRMVRLNFAPALSGDTVGRVLKKTRSSRG